MLKTMKNLIVVVVIASSGLLTTVPAGNLAVAMENSTNTDIMSSPYGTCSHLAGGQEHNAMPKNMKLMKEAGIDWARADFSWSGIERQKGVWTFDHLDYVMEMAEANHIQILPILDYHNSWADPAYKHPEDWLEYVRQTVTHFKDKIRYWEVWNEQNLKGFWHDEPDPVAYAEFLKKTYETIKAIDPNLQVVYGGLAGVPHEYYERSLQAGCAKCFDVVNIHPYRGGMVSKEAIQAFIDDLNRFHELTVKYCGEDKPLWITEMGWATPPALGRNARCIIAASIARLFPNGFNGKIGVIVDAAYPPALGLNKATWEQMLPDGVKAKRLTMNDLLTLDPKRIPMLILPPGEDFPVSYSEALLTYVKNGGTMVLLGGVPFYYNQIRSEDGTWKRGENPYTGNLSHRFRVSWIAWWTKKGTPEKTKVALATNIKNDTQTADALAIYPVTQVEGTRFFTSDKLQPGDTMEPILVPAEGSVWTEEGGETLNGKPFEAPCACIYRFNSDWKGNIVVSAIMGETLGNTNRCMADNQGTYLSQAILLALANGVDRFFCYEFQAIEQDEVDPEHHFGIMHSDLTPKTGYLEYKALTRARPAGSVNMVVNPKELGLSENDNLCVFAWKRPDGQTGWAVWSPSGFMTKKTKFSGDITSMKVFNSTSDFELTRNHEPTMWKYSENITYFVGTNIKLDFTK